MGKIISTIVLLFLFAHNAFATPSAIIDLSAESYYVPTDNKLTLRWSAPSDNGTVVGYDIRYSTAQIDAGNFNSAIPLPNSISPKQAGKRETFHATGLEYHTRYYFAVKAEDDEGNLGIVSNSPSEMTYFSVDAGSCERDDVLAAFSTASSSGNPHGGIVFIPEDDCTWTNQLNASGPISFIGAGPNRTIIRKSSGTIFNHGSVGEFVRYSGIGFYGGDANASTTSRAIYLSSANNFRIDNNHFYPSTWHGVITIKRSTRGLIDHNIFERLPDWSSNYGIQLGQNAGNDKPCPAGHPNQYELVCSTGGSYSCQDYDDPQCYAAWDRWWDLTSNNNGNEFLEDFPAGSEEMIYIEDNVFNWYGPSVQGNWGNKMAVTFRYNDVNNIKDSTGFAVKPGGVWSEAYNNHFECNGPYCEETPGGSGAYFRTSGLFFNNTMVNYNKGGIFAAYYCAYAYCYTDQVVLDETYVFDNTYVDVTFPGDHYGPWHEWSEGAPERIAENENYFFRAPQEGDRIYPYEPYIYPHPMVSGIFPETCEDKGGVEWCDTVDYVCPGTIYQGARGGTGVCCSEACVLESTPPVISNGAPTGSLLSGTTSVTLSATTDEEATCKYSQNAGQSYASMSNTFGTTGGQNHSEPITGLSDGDERIYYVKCQDVKGNFNTDGYIISFSVSLPDITPPIISGVQLSHNEQGSILSFTTDELTNGNIEYGVNTSYGAGIGFSSYGLSHNVLIPSLIPETQYYYRINAIDQSSNASSLTGQFETPSYTGWLEPLTIVQFCGQENSNPASNFIDGDRESLWHHWETEEHFIILDLGDTYKVTKIKHYHIQWATTTGIAAIYLSETNGNWGTSLGSLPGFSSEASEYKEVDIEDTTARYIRLVSENASSPYWKEFSVFVEGGESKPKPPRGLRISSRQ